VRVERYPAAEASIILATPRYRILAMRIAPRYYDGRRKPSLVIVNNGSIPGVESSPATTGQNFRKALRSSI
jgi:hypothetical protein